MQSLSTPIAALERAADGSLEACDESPSEAASPRYCPTELLASFALLMAGHGRCVNTSVMLGDGEYALWQLACARAMDDTELGGVAARLFGYFDDARAAAMAGRATA